MSLFTPMGPRQAGVVSEVRFHNRGEHGAASAADLLVDLAEGAFEGFPLAPADRPLVTRWRVFPSEEFSALESGGSRRYLGELGADRPSRGPGRLWSAARSS